MNDAQWHWADSSGEAVNHRRSSVGPHKVLIQLVNANHETLDKTIVTFVVPKQFLRKPAP
ncbi:hypothetical protein [Paraburkholderia sp. BL6669N2]|uniref:hypothetical protein n=1 Tax=Paraburkholderia sp. BL6669N2 TaxID=1938807 RepID=UPI0038D4560E